MDISIALSIISIIVIPLLTGAFVFGVMRGTINGLKEKVDNLCKAVNITHERIDKHLESHCKSCPGTTRKR